MSVHTDERGRRSVGSATPWRVSRNQHVSLVSGGSRILDPLLSTTIFVLSIMNHSTHSCLLTGNKPYFHHGE